MYTFDTEIDRSSTYSQKWDKYKNQDIIPMWVADTDFAVAPAISQALADRIQHPIFGYTDTPDALCEAFTDYLKTNYKWTIQNDQLVWLPGLVCGLHLACKAASREAEAVISATPIYPPFKTAPTLNRRKLVSVPLKANRGRWTLDLVALEQAITPTTQLLLFCNPHNPGGAVYTRRELEALAEIVIRHDLIICSDEIHCDLILEPRCKHIPIASLGQEISDRTITLMAPSKTYNIAGLGCAVAIITNPLLYKRFSRARSGMVADVNLLGYTAALAGYQHGQAWLAEQLVYLRKNRDTLLAAAKNWPEFRFSQIEATYLAWFKVEDESIVDPEIFFLDAGVGLSPGKSFGEPRHMRLNFGCTHATLLKAINRIDTALIRHRASAS